jgi:hypothetical protein
VGISLGITIPVAFAIYRYSNALKIAHADVIYLEEPGHERTGHRYVYDPDLGWRNIPNWRSTTINQALSINSKGLRDREHPYEKPPGFSRILVLGDSYAWGYGVSDDEAFPSVLEKMLGSTVGRWEVINGGVSGWGTDQEFLFLEREGVKYDPDVVLLALFLMNDPFNNASSKQYGLHKPVFLNARMELGNTPAPKPFSGAPAIQSEVEPVDLTLKIIEKMAKLCAEQGRRFAVMKFGLFLQPGNPDYLTVEKRFQDLRSESMTAPYLDLDAKFKEFGLSRPILVPPDFDGHWNAHGHLMTATIIRDFLAETGVVTLVEK